MSKIKLVATDGNGGTISLKGPTTTDGNAEFELTLPANDGSAGQYLKTDGSGALSWATPSGGAALTGSTDNTICTVTGANAIQGEANLTFDGTSLLSVHVPSATGEPAINFTNSDTGTGTGNGFGIGINDAESPYIWNRENTDLRIATNNAERVRIDSSGKVGIGETSPGTLVHMKDADVSGASFNTDDKLTIENNGTTNINLVSGTTHSQFILFSDSGDRGQGYIKYNHAIDAIAIKAGGTESIEISATDLTVKDGNLVIGTAGHGIDFSADAGGGGSGSAGSELLDDYEHGSWTPTYSDGSSYIDTGSSNFQYIKIGDLVHLWGNIRTNGSATGTASFYAQSLPFSTVNSVSYGPIGSLSGDNGWSEDLSDSNLICQMSSNSTNLKFYKNSGDTVGSITLNNIGPNANILFSINYRSA